MLERKHDALEAKVDAVDRKLEALSSSVDEQFRAVDKRFGELTQSMNEAFVEQRQYTEFAFDRLEKLTTAGLARLERKIDFLVDRAR
jgi:hypothetical protein